MAGISSILDLLRSSLSGISGGQTQPTSAPDPNLALLQALGVQMNPQALEAYKQAQAVQQGQARSMGLLTAGLGTLGATSPNRFPISGFQALSQGAGAGMQAYQNQIQQQQQQQQNLLGTVGAAQKLQSGQLELAGQRKMMELFGVTDPNQALFIMQRTSLPVLQESWKQAAATAQAQGQADKAQIYQTGLQMLATGNLKGAMEYVAKSTTMTSYQTKRVQQFEPGAEFNRVKVNLAKDILSGKGGGGVPTGYTLDPAYPGMMVYKDPKGIGKPWISPVSPLFGGAPSGEAEAPPPGE